MLYPPIGELLTHVDNRFTLCVLVGKRARQLTSGANELTKCNSKKSVTIATHEVQEGKLIYVRTKSGLK